VEIVTSLPLILLSVLPLFSMAAVTACVQTPERLDGPTQAVVGPDGRLYVADGYFNARIAVFSLDGAYLESWGSKGFGEGQFNTPHGIAVAGDGTLLVADRDNARIQRFDLSGNYLEQWSGDRIGRPWNLAVASDGSVLVVDGGDQDGDHPRSGIVQLSSDGQVLCRFSSFGSEPGQLDWGHMIALSPEDDLYVVDLNNQRLQKFVITGHEPTETDCGYSLDPDWPRLQTDAAFLPLGVAVSGNRVYVAQDEPAAPILVLDALNGDLLDSIGAGLFERAHGLSVDSENTLWVVDVDGNRVFRLGLDGEVLLQIGGE
jgi:DNA-binding beta-propeller fold protein YncE